MLDRLTNLPNEVLLLILSKISPPDTARLCLVSKKLGTTARSDAVWNAFLPADARAVAENAHPEPVAYASAKDLYDQLGSHVLFGDGSKGCWIDRKTGGVRLTFSGPALNIIWGDHSVYWTYGPEAGSRFSEVAILNHVWWLDLSSERTIKLSPGEYTVSWILQLRGNSHWVDRHGVELHLTVENEEEILSESVTDTRLSRNRRGWVAYNGGHFEVTGTDISELNLRVALKNHDCSFVKTGMWVDGIVVHSGRLDQSA